MWSRLLPGLAVVLVACVGSPTEEKAYAPDVPYLPLINQCLDTHQCDPLCVAVFQLPDDVTILSCRIKSYDAHGAWVTVRYTTPYDDSVDVGVDDGCSDASCDDGGDDGSTDDGCSDGSCDDGGDDGSTDDGGGDDGSTDDGGGDDGTYRPAPVQWHLAPATRR